MTRLGVRSLTAARARRLRYPVSIKGVFQSPAGEVVLLLNERQEWELPGGQVLRTWGEVSNKVSCLAFSPDGAMLALGGKTKIRVFKLATDQLKGQWEAHGRQILALAWSVCP